MPLHTHNSSRWWRSVLSSQQHSSTGVCSSSRTENHTSNTVCKTLWTHVEQRKMCLWFTNTISWMKVAVVVIHLRRNTIDKTKSSKGFWQIREQGRQDRTLAHRGRDQQWRKIILHNLIPFELGCQWKANTWAASTWRKLILFDLEKW